MLELWQAVELPDGTLHVRKLGEYSDVPSALAMIWDGALGEFLVCDQAGELVAVCSKE